MRLAALDLGSLTVRLAVAEGYGPGHRRIVHRGREITGLAEGMTNTGELAHPAMARTLAAVAHFAREIDRRQVERVLAVATQAVRQARNREAFLAEVRKVWPWPVEVLPPAAEARLTLAGVLSVLDPAVPASGPVLVFDLGGGSTEFALIRPGQEPVLLSLPLGVLTLSQTRPLGDPPEPGRVAALQQELRERLQNFRRERFPGLPGSGLRLVGTAGAVTTLAAMSLKMTAYDPERVNNLTLTRGQVEELAALLMSHFEAERARLPGVEAKKAPFMPAGALIVLAVLEMCGAEGLTVSDAGLLEGVMAALAKES
ncbi:MAG: Ppx/GppA family phosphatase [Deltaproteobacteria bacterium]|nr:Ppx/GppA family phosphatase [Deltaproteobacteria bacterium]